MESRRRVVLLNITHLVYTSIELFNFFFFFVAFYAYICINLYGYCQRTLQSGKCFHLTQWSKHYLGGVFFCATLLQMCPVLLGKQGPRLKVILFPLLNYAVCDLSRSINSTKIAIYL